MRNKTIRPAPPTHAPKPDARPTPTPPDYGEFSGMSPDPSAWTVAIIPILIVILFLAILWSGL